MIKMINRMGWVGSCVVGWVGWWAGATVLGGLASRPQLRVEGGHRPPASPPQHPPQPPAQRSEGGEGDGGDDVECGWAMRAVGVDEAVGAVRAVRAVFYKRPRTKGSRWGQWQRSEGGERWGEEGW